MQSSPKIREVPRDDQAVLKNGPRRPITLMSMRLLILLAVMMGAEGLAAQQILTDDDVVKMVQAGVAQDLILKLIAESPVLFRVQPDHVVAWKQAGVPDDVARAMVARQSNAPRIQYVHFSSEVRVTPAKHRRGLWAQFKHVLTAGGPNCGPTRQ